MIFRKLQLQTPQCTAMLRSAGSALGVGNPFVPECNRQRVQQREREREREREQEIKKERAK